MGRQAGVQFHLVSLTFKDPVSDAEARAALQRFLAWGRKFYPELFSWYVWVAELQQRGVLHFHVLLPGRVPLQRMRSLWVGRYGFGEGSVDVERMRSVKGAASYLAKYLTAKRPDAFLLGLDGEGQLVWEPWAVSRHNGRPYVRMRFEGNPYGMSKQARLATKPVTTFVAAVGAFPGFDSWHGEVAFFDASDEAEAFLAELLAVGLRV